MLGFSYICSLMEIKTRLIVLRTVKYGDSRLIVDALTAEAGRVSFITSLSRTGRGKAKVQFFQPLSILDVVYDDRKGKGLPHFKDIRLAFPYVSIPFSPVKLSICLFLAEFLTYASRGENNNDHLAAFVENSLRWLDGASANYANFHLVFMMRVSLFIGFYPNMEGYSDGSWFDLRDSCFSPVCPPHPDYLSPADASRVRVLLRMTFENMHLFRMNREERNKCVEVIMMYYRLHVPDFPELRSLEVLKTLF